MEPAAAGSNEIWCDPSGKAAGGSRRRPVPATDRAPYGRGLMPDCTPSPLSSPGPGPPLRRPGHVGGILASVTGAGKPHSARYCG
ncbi:hypothetical protein [Azospirillum endophyticum]